MLLFHYSRAWKNRTPYHPSGFKERLRRPLPGHTPESIKMTTLTYICTNCQEPYSTNYRPGNPDRPYCSRSCATSYNNRVNPKRKLEGSCLVCKTPIKKDKRVSTCTNCRKPKIDYRLLTVGEYRNLLSVKGKHPSWANAHVRNFARSWNKKLRSMPCEVCSYSVHVELAHIKPVSSYPDDATLGEINHPSNLRVLCPNHHWEFDNLPR